MGFQSYLVGNDMNITVINNSSVLIFNYFMCFSHLVS